MACCIVRRLIAARPAPQAAVSVLTAASAVESARTVAPLLLSWIYAVGSQADCGERRSGVRSRSAAERSGLACRLGRGFCGYTAKVATGDPHPYERRRWDLKSDKNLWLSSDFKCRYAQCLPIIEYFFIATNWQSLSTHYKYSFTERISPLIKFVRRYFLFA